MESDLASIRLGIPALGDKHWMGGVTYVELLLKAIRSVPHIGQKIQIFLVSNDLESLPLYDRMGPLIDGLIVYGVDNASIAPLLSAPSCYVSQFSEVFKSIDVLAPVNSRCHPGLPVVSWIPDFQPMKLPQFFSNDEVQFATQKFSEIASNGLSVIFSSEDAQRDFRSLFPESQIQSHVLRFFSLPEESWYVGSPLDVQLKYNLPDRFFICCNQFWQHKNHLLLFEAIASLVKDGVVEKFVFTGNTTDYRLSGYMTTIEERIDQLGIREHIALLGMIPRADQLQLVRRSMALIQPSLFEGWSTVVEDSRALGKKTVLSDLSVHKEQNPPGAVFFDRNSVESLRDAVVAILPGLSPGPDLEAESLARAKVQSSATEYGMGFLKVISSTLPLFSKQSDHTLAKEVQAQRRTSVESVCECPGVGKGVSVGSGVKIGPGAIIESVTEDSETRVIIEDNVEIGARVVIRSAGTITIKRGAVLSPGVFVQDFENSEMAIDEPYLQQKHVGGQIIIEEGVCIGCNGGILGTVTIGENSTIGPGCVVRLSLPSGSIVAGRS